MDCPAPRPVSPPAHGKGMAVPEMGGLHHHYERQQAAWVHQRALALQTLQDGFVGDAFCLREELEKLLDRYLEFTFRPVAYFAEIPLAKRTLGHPARKLLNTADVGIPAHKGDEQRDDRRMFAHRFGRVLVGQGAFSCAHCPRASR